MLPKIFLMVAAVLAASVSGPGEAVRAAFQAPPDSGGLEAKARAAGQALEEERFEDAARLFAELVSGDPANPGFRMSLGMAQQSLERHAEAVEQFEAVLRARPDSPAASLLLGLSYLRLNQPAKAVQPLERALQAEPANRSARLELASALLAAGRAEEAGQHFLNLAQRDAGHARAWHGLTVSYLALAGRAAAKVAEADRDSAWRLALEARRRTVEGKYSAAAALFRRALKKKPGLRGAHAALAGVYAAGGDKLKAAAEEERERALGQPDCTAAPLECLFRDQQYWQLVDAARSMDTPESHYWRALAYYELSDISLDRLADTHSAETSELSAEVLERQGRYRAAAGQWREAAEVSPEDPRLLKGLARCLYASGDYAGASPLLERLSRMEPQSAEWAWKLGDAMVQLHHAADAIPHLKKAMALEPGIAQAHKALAYALELEGRTTEAAGHLRQAAGMDEDGSLHARLGALYEKSGEPELAREARAKARELSGLP